MRGRYPDFEGAVSRDGVRIHYEVFGSGERALLLLPTWSIIHSRHWKGQVPYFARRYRVITFDGRGNGLSDRPQDATAYSDDEFAADAVAVMDATETPRATVVGLSAGSRYALLLAAERPERVEAAVFVGPAVPLAPDIPGLSEAKGRFHEPQAEYQGWAKLNRHHWLNDHRDFLEFFFGQAYPEPHSTKQIEDTVDWGLATTPATLVATAAAPALDRARAAELAAKVRCPVLVVHGSDNRISPHERGAALAAATGGRLLTMTGSGHCPHTRDPVRFNIALRDFLEPDASRHWTRARARAKHALYISSPIGLGHARRDLAIARELRRHHPELEITWLAQHPVTLLLEEAGERVHPASAELVSESAHIESESSQHRLPVFSTWRGMDEVLLTNFMVFHDLVREEAYDLWIGDEAWELDYYLHENPELKTAPYAWLTDFVGWIPMPSGGEREAFLTADYNAEMIEQVERFPRVRDRAVFIGNPTDVVPGRFGPGLPLIRPWVRRHYDFSGYVLGADVPHAGERKELRSELGYGKGETVCVASVGGSGVGAGLLARLMEAYPAVKTRIPGLRLIAIAGPRLDPASLPAVPGVEVRGFIPDLPKHLAACDLALVQGGLATAMELAAARQRFIYFPLIDHCEQRVHVRHRLERYRAGCFMDYEEATPDKLADAIAAELAQPVRVRPVERDGAKRAALLLAPLLAP
ncbi:MAG TPA: alpha/beta fold hydrolase [Candidatus Dormibacteraeota bacterium]